VTAGVLPLQSRIDAARPGLTSSGALAWQAQGYVLPSATWTDITTERRNQFLLFVLGALVGICASVIATVAFEWAHG
jgi:hypothetical protein